MLEPNYYTAKGFFKKFTSNRNKNNKYKNKFEDY